MGGPSPRCQKPSTRASPSRPTRNLSTAVSGRGRGGGRLPAVHAAHSQSPYMPFTVLTPEARACLGPYRMYHLASANAPIGDLQIWRYLDELTRNLLSLKRVKR